MNWAVLDNDRSQTGMSVKLDTILYIHRWRRKLHDEVAERRSSSCEAEVYVTRSCVDDFMMVAKREEEMKGMLESLKQYIERYKYKRLRWR